MKQPFNIIIVLLGLLCACGNAGSVREKHVIFLAPEGFRGPFTVSIDTDSDVLPIVRGQEIVYSIPPSRIITVGSMNLSNGALWENYSVRYPGGGIVKTTGPDATVSESETYLWQDGSYKHKKTNLVDFFVGSLAERSRLRELSEFDRARSIPIWEKRKGQVLPADIAENE